MRCSRRGADLRRHGAATRVVGGPQQALGAAMQGMLRLDGMTTIYALMAAFHRAPWLQPPWLKLRRRRDPWTGPKRATRNTSKEIVQ
ncbi:MAG TPA: hypothetical protein VGL83_13270 [Stellaceae bacterium]